MLSSILPFITSLLTCNSSPFFESPTQLDFRHQHGTSILPSRHPCVLFCLFPFITLFTSLRLSLSVCCSSSLIATVSVGAQISLSLSVFVLHTEIACCLSLSSLSLPVSFRCLYVAFLSSTYKIEA